MGFALPNMAVHWGQPPRQTQPVGHPPQSYASHGASRTDGASPSEQAGFPIKDRFLLKKTTDRRLKSPGPLFNSS
jgi:hypothetical protein